MSESAGSPPSPAKLNKAAVFGFAMFDFANSSFTTVMVTAYFSIYFQNILVARTPGYTAADGTALWGLCQGISQAIVMLSAPIVGALADFSGSKKKFLFISYAGCALFTLSLGWIGPGDIALCMALFILGNVFYSSGENIVGAFLPEVAPPEKIGLVSGMSWGVGYIGGIAALVLSLLILENGPKEADGTPIWYPYVWMAMGLWFLLAGAPTFVFMGERHKHETMPPGFNIATIGFHRLAKTLREAHRFRQLFRFLMIFTLIYSGLCAVVSFAAIIADKTLKLNSTQLGIFLIYTNIVAVPGAWGWGWLQDRIGSRKAINLSLLTWFTALALVISINPNLSGDQLPASSKALFWIAGAFVGIGMGATSSSCRALVGLFSPDDRLGEFFGLWGLFGKLGAIIGPVTFGLVAKFAGDMRWAEVAVGLYFLAAFILMFKIDEHEGRAAAGRPAVGAR